MYMFYNKSIKIYFIIIIIYTIRFAKVKSIGHEGCFKYFAPLSVPMPEVS
jgi:hypothetical protein